MATIIPLKVPALSPTMTDGKLVEWRKKEGDEVKANEVIARLETDKAVLDWESVEAGYIAALLVPGGTPNLSVGQIVGIMVEDKSELEEGKKEAEKYRSATPGAAAAAAATPSAAAPASAPKAAAAATAAAPSEAAVSVSHSAPLSPAVLHLLLTERIDPSSITATGKGGRLTKADVLKALKAGTARKLSAVSTSAASPAALQAPRAQQQPQPQQQQPVTGTQPGEPSTGRRARTYTDFPLSSMRKTIAARLNKIATPHHYVAAKCRMDALIKLRKELKERHGAEASINDFIVKAAAVALRRVPEMNARYDAAKQEVVQLSDVDISVAVAIPEGLITPIVKDADKKSVGQISKDTKDLASRARAGALKPQEYQGGSFTISNLGMYGITEFSAIINPPQGAILAVGATTASVVPANSPDITGEEENFAGIGKFEVVQSMTVTLSCDPRVADADTAQRWLSAFKEAVEHPEQLLI